MPAMVSRPPPGHEPWRSRRAVAARRLPSALRPWLLETGSLTRSLRRACPGGFRLRLLYQGWRRPLPQEARRLGLGPRRRALVREVCLSCHGRPWVFARTVVPPAGLKGPGRRLARLGDRPLGALLFAQRGLRRGPLELAALAPPSPLFARAAACGAASPPLWGRRSLYRLRGRPVLVTEVFLSRLPAHPGEAP